MRFLLSLLLIAACGDTNDPVEEAAVGYEIVQIVSPNELVAWAGVGITQEEFDAIELPAGWFKNQPREIEMDGGRFFRSPDASVDGPLDMQEHFGHTWMHVATITEANQMLDDEGLLRGNTIRKFHEVTFDAGRTLNVLMSPEGSAYVRVTRDYGRTTDTPTLPAGWRLVEHVTPDPLVIMLPNPTLNIRADNEDSFQGPVSQLDGVGSE